MAKSKRYFLLLLSFSFLSLLSTSKATTDINVTVPSTLSIILNEDETNSITPLIIQNEMNAPIILKNITINLTGEWSLAPNQTFFEVDQKQINICIENVSLADGKNDFNLLIEDQKELDIQIYRGAFRDSFVSSEAFEMVFDYELTEINYTLSLDNQGAISTYLLASGKELSLPKPEKKGYLFKGWMDATSEKLYPADELFIMPDQDVTLISSFEKEIYKITYDLDGGILLSNTLENYSISQDSIILPTASKEGYLFDGWLLNQSSTPIYQIEPDSIGHMELKASWKLPTITLLYNDSITESKTLQINQASLLPTPTRFGYQFDGWYIASLSNTMNITNFYNPNDHYPWTLNIDTWSTSNQGIGSTTSAMISEPFTLSESGTLSFQWRSYGENNYDYLGYDIYDLNSNTYLSKQNVPTYQKCIKNLKGKASTDFVEETYTLESGTYQVLFMYGKDSSINKNEDTAYVKNICVNDVRNYQVSDMYRPDIFLESTVLIAKWIPLEYSYIIKNVSTTGKELSTYQIVHPFASTHTIFPLNHDGYTAPKSQTVTWDNPSKTIIFTYTPNEYTIIYTLDEGTLVEDAIYSYTIENGIVHLPAATKEGYEFVGWYDNSSFSGAHMTSFSASDLSNKHFYASWKALPTYKLTTGWTLAKSYIPEKTTHVIFTDSLALEGTPLNDLSAAQDNSVVGWLEDTTYYISSQVKGQKIIANENCANMFGDFPNLQWVDFSNLDTSNTTNLSYMFYQTNMSDYSFISQLDTTNVTNMQYMFRNCSNMTQIDLSHFDTSNLTNIRHMFYNCENLKSVDFSGWDTSKISDMSYLFYSCEALESLNIRHFDTSSLVNTEGMLNYCHHLKELDLRSFDMRNVTNMASMLETNYALETIHLGPLWRFVDLTLPKQYSQWLTGSDGNWYSQDGTAYTPDELSAAYNENPTSMAGTYFAIKP